MNSTSLSVFNGKYTLSVGDKVVFNSDNAHLRDRYAGPLVIERIEAALRSENTLVYLVGSDIGRFASRFEPAPVEKKFVVVYCSATLRTREEAEKYAQSLTGDCYIAEVVAKGTYLVPTLGRVEFAPL